MPEAKISERRKFRRFRTRFMARYVIEGNTDYSGVKISRQGRPQQLKYPGLRPGTPQRWLRNAFILLYLLNFSGCGFNLENIKQNKPGQATGEIIIGPTK
jgi:hypothetical protein